METGLTKYNEIRFVSFGITLSLGPHCIRLLTGISTPGLYILLDLTHFIQTILLHYSLIHNSPPGTFILYFQHSVLFSIPFTHPCSPFLCLCLSYMFFPELAQQLPFLISLYLEVILLSECHNTFQTSWMVCIVFIY